MLSKGYTPESGATAKGEKQCIWTKAGVVSFRVCTPDFLVSGDVFATLMAPSPEKRQCRHMLTGDVAYKICPRNYECFHCEVDQRMQDAIANHPSMPNRNRIKP